jgi:hypothetical protein
LFLSSSLLHSASILRISSTKGEITHEIAAYKWRSTTEKPVKAWEECTEAELEIVRNRQKVIAAFEWSGFSPKRFVESYRYDDFLSEVNTSLGQ